MKRVLSMSILAAGLLLLAPTIQAQELADPVRDPGAPASQAPGPCGTLGLVGPAGHLRLHRHRVAGPVGDQPGAAEGLRARDDYRRLQRQRQW